MKLKLLLLIISISLCQFCLSQSSIELVFFPIVDFNGIYTYVRKSELYEFKHPKKTTKIYYYNENLDIVGYWVGVKMKYKKGVIPQNL